MPVRAPSREAHRSLDRPPGPGGLGYKYITTNGITGHMKFLMVNNPKRDFRDGQDYVFAMHYEDKVYALSQPITLDKLQVVGVGSDDLLRRSAFREKSRGRGVRRPATGRKPLTGPCCASTPS